MGESRKRVRRSVGASKLAILEAAERRLISDGPNGVKVQPIARELGLTDAAVHYHFGSRDGLLGALLRFSGRKFVEEMEAALAAPEQLSLREIAGRLKGFYEGRGSGRLAMWLSLSGWEAEGSGMLEPLVNWLHAQRMTLAKTAGTVPPDRKDSQRVIAVLSTTTLSQGLFGDAVARSVGLSPGASHDIVDWVVDLLEAHTRRS